MELWNAISAHMSTAQFWTAISASLGTGMMCFIALAWGRSLAGIPLNGFADIAAVVLAVDALLVGDLRASSVSETISGTLFRTPIVREFLVDNIVQLIMLDIAALVLTISYGERVWRRRIQFIHSQFLHRDPIIGRLYTPRLIRLRLLIIPGIFAYLIPIIWLMVHLAAWVM